MGQPYPYGGRMSAHSHVILPTFHSGQIAAWNARTQFFALCCGRRWGKTDFAKIVVGDAAIKGKTVGIFVPNYKIMVELYNEMEAMLFPIKRTSSKAEWRQSFLTGGRIDYWSLENEQAGRSRRYDLVVIDEAAFAKNSTMNEQWDKAIYATIFDTGGSALVMSTPNGVNDENFFYRVCQRGNPQGFTLFHAPTYSNPLIPYRKIGETDEEYRLRRNAEFQKVKDQKPPLVYRQEFLAEFVDWGGDAFFDISKMLVKNAPVEYPQHVEYVVATIDTAVKDGQENDGTAVCFWAVNKYGKGAPLTLLDWDIVQVTGNLLIDWLPGIYTTLEELAVKCKARYGTGGCFIEDKISGTILLQQSAVLGYQTTPIPGKITDKGKDGRALGVSGYYHREQIKIHEVAWNRTKNYKGEEKNHLLDQIKKFYLADKDLLDAFVYGPACVFGIGEDIFE
jgi:hypothetical protein